MVEGLRYVWSTPGLRNVFFATSIINFFLAPVIMLLPFFVEDTLGLRAEWYGSLMIALSLGVITGYGISGVVKVANDVRDKVLFAALIVLSVSFGALGYASSIYFAWGAIFLAGTSSGFVSVNFLTILQTQTEGHLRGRVFGYLTTLTGGLAPFASGISGVVADLTGKNIPMIYLACGVCTLLSCCVFILNREFRAFLRFRLEPAEA
ncbi:MAG: MFS transporter [Pseudomonadota bacterium]